VDVIPQADADDFQLSGGFGEQPGGAVEMAVLGAVFELAEGGDHGADAAGQAGAGQFVGQMIDIRDGAFGNGLFQAGHDFAGLVEIKVHQFAQQMNVAVAGGLKLIEINHRLGGPAIWIGSIQWLWY